MRKVEVAHAALAIIRLSRASDERLPPGKSLMETDGSYICDSCGEEIVIPVDPSGGASQSYVEDCPVCCNPSVLHVQWIDDQPRVWAEPAQDR